MGDAAPRIELNRLAIPPEAYYDRFKPDSVDELMNTTIPMLSKEAASARVMNIIGMTDHLIRCVPTVIPLASQDSPHPVVSLDEAEFRIKVIFEFFERVATGEWIALIRGLPRGAGAGLRSIAEIVEGIHKRWGRRRDDFYKKLMKAVEAGWVKKSEVPEIMSAPALPPRTIEPKELDALKGSLELVLSAFSPPSGYLRVRLNEGRFEATRDGVKGVARFNRRTLIWNLFCKFVKQVDGFVPKEIITKTWEETDLEEVPVASAVDQAFLELNGKIKILSLKINAKRDLGRVLVDSPAPDRQGGSPSPQPEKAKKPPGGSTKVKKAPRRRR
jgi:hypothetical protein